MAPLVPLSWLDALSRSCRLRHALHAGVPSLTPARVSADPLALLAWLAARGTPGGRASRGVAGVHTLSPAGSPTLPGGGDPAKAAFARGMVIGAQPSGANGMSGPQTGSSSKGGSLCSGGSKQASWRPSPAAAPRAPLLAGVSSSSSVAGLRRRGARASG